jgi:2-methylcitrate dehydratase PrpD
MTSTAELVELATSMVPSRDLLDVGARELALFADACSAGADDEPTVAIRRIAPPGQHAQWTAWISGAAAMAAPRPPAWAAICAAASALGRPADDISKETAEDGKVIDAIAVGYKAAGLVAADLTAARQAGWSLPATAGLVGAGVAAARVARLSAAQVRNALGLCATQAAGLARLEGTSAAAVQVGKAAADAVEAVLLSRSGFTSSAQSLEGRRGLYALLSAQ